MNTLRPPSLQARLSLVLTVLIAVLMAAGAAVWMRETRQAIHEEVEAATRVAQQWIGVLLPEAQAGDEAARARLLARLAAVGRIRANHLEVFAAGGAAGLRIARIALQGGPRRARVVRAAPRARARPAPARRRRAGDRAHARHLARGARRLGPPQRRARLGVRRCCWRSGSPPGRRSGVRSRRCTTSMPHSNTARPGASTSACRNTPPASSPCSRAATTASPTASTRSRAENARLEAGPERGARRSRAGSSRSDARSRANCTTSSARASPRCARSPARSSSAAPSSPASTAARRPSSR
jgi:hypothetical protein